MELLRRGPVAATTTTTTTNIVGIDFSKFLAHMLVEKGLLFLLFFFVAQGALACPLNLGAGQVDSGGS